MQNILIFNLKIYQNYLKRKKNCVRIETRNSCIVCNGLLRGKNTFPRFSKCRVGLKKIKKCWCKFI